jgi:hypothetical protein
VPIPPPPAPDSCPGVVFAVPPEFPCGGLTGGLFPVPAANVQEPPPPDPPLPAEKLVQAAPLPPPVDVIVEKTELLPELPAVAQFAGAAPPPPTVIGYVVAEYWKRLQHYNLDLEKLFYNHQLHHLRHQLYSISTRPPPPATTK